MFQAFKYIQDMVFDGQQCSHQLGTVQNVFRRLLYCSCPPNSNSISISNTSDDRRICYAQIPEQQRTRFHEVTTGSLECSKTCDVENQESTGLKQSPLFTHCTCLKCLKTQMLHKSSGSCSKMSENIHESHKRRDSAALITRRPVTQYKLHDPSLITSCNKGGFKITIVADGRILVCWQIR